MVTMSPFGTASSFCAELQQRLDDEQRTLLVARQEQDHVQVQICMGELAYLQALAWRNDIQVVLPQDSAQLTDDIPGAAAA